MEPGGGGPTSGGTEGATLFYCKKKWKTGTKRPRKVTKTTYLETGGERCSYNVQSLQCYEARPYECHRPT